ncbi:MAG: YdbH domain-containing protein [Minwuia sp.]|nr:YdbH domain-containing protein [Minwuia sp.]
MRRTTKFAIWLLLGLGVLVVATVLARKPLVAWAATTYLASRGVEPARLSVTRLDLEGAEIADLRIGAPDAPHVSVRQLIVRLDGFEVSTLSVEGVAIVGTLRDGRPDIGPVMALVASEPSAAEPAPPGLPVALPDLTLTDLRLALKGPQGDLGLDFSGMFRLVRGVLKGDGELQVAGPGGKGAGDLQLALQPDLTGHGTLAARDVTIGPPWLSRPLVIPQLSLRADRSGEHASADLTADIADGVVSASLLGVGPFDRPTLDLGVQVDLPALAPLLPLLVPFTGDLPLADAAIDLSLALSGTGAEAPDLATQLLNARGELTLTGQVTVTPAPEATGGQAQTMDLELELDGAFDPASIDLLVRKAGAGVKGLKPAGIPEDIARLLGPTAALAVEPGFRIQVSRDQAGTAQMRGGFTASSGTLALAAGFDALDLLPEGIQGSGAVIDLKGLVWDGLALDQLAFRGDIGTIGGITVKGALSGAGAEWQQREHVVSAPEFRLDLNVQARSVSDMDGQLQGTLRAASLSLADGAVEVFQPTLKLGSLVIAASPQGGMSLKGEAVMNQSGLRLASVGTAGMIQADPQLITLDLAGAEATALTGTVALNTASVTVPGLAATGAVSIKGQVELVGETIVAIVQGNRVQVDRSLMEGIPAIDVEVQVTADPQQLNLHGTAVSGPARVLMSGNLQPETGTADAVIALDPTALSLLSDHLRGTILPEGMAMPDGTVSVRTDLIFDNALSGKLNVVIQGGEVATPEATLSGINTDIRLDNILPPSTSAMQEVRIARLAGPAEMTDLLLRFGLSQDGDETVARIAHMAGSVFGGELALEPFTLRPDETSRAVDVALRRIDMSQIVELTGLTGFALSGTLSGTLPVTIVGDSQVAVRGGLLKADAPGTLRLDGASLRGVLGQQGVEQLDLMIQALEDFRYDVLEIAIEKALEGDADMRVTLGGQNPAVLDGHPFRFNVSVKGNADRLLETILTVYRASGGVIEQGIKSLQ